MPQNVAVTFRALIPIIVLAGCAGCESTTAPGRSLADTIETFHYASTIDLIPDLFARCRSSREGLPVVIIMHGFGLEAKHFTPTIFDHLSRKGVTVCALGMRGRDGAGGVPDVNGREVQDIVDGLAVIRDRYRTNARAAIVGYSGGGANALAVAGRFPAAFDVAVDYFGISDFAAWYYESPTYQSTMRAYLGGSPSEVPDAYKARDLRPALSAYRGQLFVFHDSEDGQVPVQHSLRLRGGRAQVFISGPGDAGRYVHGHPDGGVTAGDTLWLGALLGHFEVR